MKRREILKIGATGLATLPAAWAAQASRVDWKPSILDDHQNQTVIALCDLIIPATDTPGARAANVNRYIDLYLRDGSAMQRERFLEGLSWLDGHAIREHGHSFIGCTAAQQAAMFAGLEENEGPGQSFFRRAKSMIARIYYATEIGYRELNKGGRAPATFGCRHASHG